MLQNKFNQKGNRLAIWRRICFGWRELNLRLPRHRGAVELQRDRWDMKIKLAASAVALALGFAASAHAASDLTINYGSTAAPYSASGLFQIVEAGNPFSDMPRTVVDDAGGSLSGGGSSAPLTTSDFTIDLVFTTLQASSFSAGLQSALPDAPATFDLFKGSSLLASGVGTGNVNISPVTIGAGTYTLSITGAVDSSLESEGGFQFSGTPSAVPEPATWAMMLIGFGGLGAALRGSRRLGAA